MAKIARRTSREEISGFSLFGSSLGEVHEVMTLASDAPGSLFRRVGEEHPRLRAPLIPGA